MSKTNPELSIQSSEPIRRLSPWRVLLAILILLVLSTSTVFAIKKWQSEQSDTSTKPWFAAYVDVTATPTFQFQDIGNTAQKDAVLAFIVAMPSNGCQPSWGAAYSLNQAEDELSLDTRIARLQQEGGSVAISFGGKNNNELAVTCTNPSKLLNAYKTVIDRYNINTIDLDIEGSDLTNVSAGLRRSIAIATLQKERRSEGRHLAVWLTLPVTPQGLTPAGTNAVSQLLSHGVDLAGVNIMTMDYGSSLTAGQNMITGTESAMIQTHRQLGILYQRDGIYLNSATLWSKIGITPMIGQNDDQNEVFTINDAKTINQFALSQRIGRMSMWSANRDLTCGSNYVDLKVVSNSCSGVNQKGQSFANILGNGFTGNLSLSAGLITKTDAKLVTSQAPDNPATSPYQIWSPNGTYLEGTKVVWQHNIYQAKWWTQGNLPNDPVLQTWQTPWELIGPVLPGEKPIKQATLPAGTYPNWSGTTIYNTNQRVLFNGVPYQAKWWNRGNSPAAASSDPDGSPWVALTQAQINKINQTLNKTN